VPRDDRVPRDLLLAGLRHGRRPGLLGPAHAGPGSATVDLLPRPAVRRAAGGDPHGADPRDGAARRRGLPEREGRGDRAGPGRGGDRRRDRRGAQAMIELVLFGSFLVLLFLGVPVAFSMGLSAFAAIIYQSGTRALSPTSGVLYAGLSSETLLAIPLFILAGTIMALTGISARLIELADALVGHRKTGIALTTILVALIFSSISGSGPATVAAIGGILIPALARRGYTKRHAASLVASAGEMGIILPPSIAYIVFAVIASDYERVSIGRLFMAGVVPGLILLLAFYVVAVFLPRTGDLAKASASAHVDHALGRSSRPGRGVKGALSGVADTTADSTPAHDRATASAGATGQSAS